MVGGVGRRRMGWTVEVQANEAMDRLTDINKHCLEEFRRHWDCLENNNHQLWQCRRVERPLNQCVFANLVCTPFRPFPHYPILPCGVRSGADKNVPIRNSKKPSPAHQRARSLSTYGADRSTLIRGEWISCLEGRRRVRRLSRNRERRGRVLWVDRLHSSACCVGAGRDGGAIEQGLCAMSGRAGEMIVHNTHEMARHIAGLYRTLRRRLMLEDLSPMAFAIAVAIVYLILVICAFALLTLSKPQDRKRPLFRIIA